MRLLFTSDDSTLSSTPRTPGEVSRAAFFFWNVIIAGLLLMLCFLISLVVLFPSNLYTLLIGCHVALLIFSLVIGAAELGHLARQSTKVTKFVFLFSALIILGIGVLSVHPPTAKDALTHHLFTVMRGSRNAINPPSWHEWSFYPMLIQQVYGELLYRGRVILVGVYTALYLPLLLSAMTFFLRERGFSSSLALQGGVFLAIIPVCLAVAGEPLVDLPLTLFCLVGVHFIIKSGVTHKRVDIFGAGLALGAALCIKYNTIPFYVVLLLSALLIGKKGERCTLREFLTCTGIALLVFSPWLLRNYLIAGNPVYPLYNKLFGITSAPTMSLPSLSPLLQRVVLYEESWIEIILTPIRLFLLGRDGDPVHFDGVASPFLVLVFALPFLRSVPRWVKCLAWSAFLYLLIALVSTSWRIRYLLPIFPLLVAVLWYLLVRIKKGERLLIPAIVIAQCVISGVYLCTLISRVDNLPYLLGRETSESYVARKVPGYALLQRVNQHVPLKGRVYFLYTQNPFFYLKGNPFSGGYRSERDLVSWIRQSDTTAALHTQFIQHGIYSLFVHVPLMHSGLSSILTPEQQKLWNEFAAQYLEERERDGAYAWFEVREAAK